MRNGEIWLFRGKRIDNGEWVEGGIFADVNDRRVYIIADCAYPVLNDSIGEYSGVKAKEGRRIFEGDMLTGLFHFGMSVTGVCEFRDGSFGMKWMRGAVEEFVPFTSMWNIECEIVGNVSDSEG